MAGSRLAKRRTGKVRSFTEHRQFSGSMCGSTLTTSTTEIVGPTISRLSSSISSIGPYVEELFEAVNH